MTAAKSNALRANNATTDEFALDDAIEMSFPASDPLASSTITRIQTDKSTDLHQMKIAVLVTDGFEQAELLGPRAALEAAGARVEVISDKVGSVQGFVHTNTGKSVGVDKTFDDACSEDYAAILLPGGVVNGDAMRLLPQARKFIQDADRLSKPIASICHGGWLLISAGVARERTVTSWPSLQDDFQNAGAIWIDQEVVRDENFISLRNPDDIPAFNSAFISLLQEQQILNFPGRD